MGDKKQEPTTRNEMRAHPAIDEDPPSNVNNPFRILFETMTHGAVFQDSKGKIKVHKKT